MADYSVYNNYVSNLTSLTTFKAHPNYTYMLEHVNKEQGEAYYQLLIKLYPINIIESFCKLNDSIGSPHKYSFYALSIPVSPTSLRYLYHAHLILRHFASQPEIHIVEVGGGYGGLCLALHFLSNLLNKTINSYHIIDLDSAGKLQKKYLENFSISVETSSASEYGKSLTRTDYCFVSNYCFSEIDKIHQDQYIEHLIPKTKTGFLAWNNIPLYNFGKEVVSETENPLTGPRNLYVYF